MSRHSYTVRGMLCGKTPVLLLGLILGTAIVGCDDGDGGAPDVADIPRGAVAIVGDETITKHEFDRRLAAIRRSQSRGGRQPLEQLRKQAMGLLIRRTALEQEAVERGVTVTDAEVRRQVERARRQFSNASAFRRFLGEQTEQDLIYALRTQTLAQKIGDRLRKDGGDYREFDDGFERRWKEQTACRLRFLVSACGNAPSPGSADQT